MNITEFEKYFKVNSIMLISLKKYLEASDVNFSHIREKIKVSTRHSDWKTIKNIFSFLESKIPEKYEISHRKPESYKKPVLYIGFRAENILIEIALNILWSLHHDDFEMQFIYATKPFDLANEILIGDEYDREKTYCNASNRFRLPKSEFHEHPNIEGFYTGFIQEVLQKRFVNTHWPGHNWLIFSNGDDIKLLKSFKTSFYNRSYPIINYSRDTFNALTDGQLGDYDDFIDSGQSLDDLYD